MRRSRRRAFRVLAVAALLATPACSLLADFDIPTDTLGEADAAATDGALGPGVLLKDDFESALPTCGWMIEEGTASPDSLARTGSGGCRFCSTGGRIRIERRLPELRAGSYQLVAHYRQLPGKPTPTRWTMRLVADLEDADNASNETSGVLGQTYAEGQTTITTKQDATSVIARIGVEQSLAAGECLLVDDISASWSPP